MKFPDILQAHLRRQLVQHVGIAFQTLNGRQLPLALNLDDGDFSRFRQRRYVVWGVVETSGYAGQPLQRKVGAREDDGGSYPDGGVEGRCRVSLVVYVSGVDMDEGMSGFLVHR